MDRSASTLCLLVALAAALPLGSATPPAWGHAEAERACAGPLPGAWCAVRAASDLSALACDAASCLVVVEVAAVGTAPLMGLLRVESTLVTDPPFLDGPCLGAPEPEFCGVVCSTLALGDSASCEGRAEVALPLGGDGCARVVVAGTLNYDAVAGFAGVALDHRVCRLADGSPHVTSASG